MTAAATRTDHVGRTQARVVWPHNTALACGAACAAFAHGNFAIPVAGWLAPFFLLLGVRGAGGRTLLVGAVLLATAQAAAWRGALPFNGWIYFAVTTAVGLTFYLPYLADRLLYPKLPAPLSTLVFPLGLVSVETIFSRVGYGTWGLLGYSQAGELPLLQVLSVAGLAGLTFLIGWAASVAADVVRYGLHEKGRRYAAAAALALLGLSLALGGMRVALARPGGTVVRIAGITIENDAIFKDTWGPLTYGKPLSVDQAVAAAARTHELQQALLQRTERAAAEGARIVVWSEGNALVFRSDEPSFLEQGRRLARQNGIYLFMSLATMSPGDRLVENKVVAIDAEGRIRDVYLKSHPTPGEMSRPGDGRIGWMDTPYGRIAWAICYDFDYPELIRQAGRVGADILIDPSWENAGMTPLHTQMATFRAIENGAALFRPVNGGLGMAVDAYGRVLGTLDHFTTGTPDKVLVADLRTKGVATLYPAVGDAFGWLCGGGLALLALVAVRVRWSEGCRRA